ncbi:ABC-F family ATP-binding cassette domain-containing protein [Acidisoma cellulosilytica]|uniref:ABC-F family ATP-binding cassette domain-containing protein n=1 Tax=Acidisoma cellulosilyticum TaxID=2802395 RepID=A0A963Z1B8_9PROT|nr:ABC-F family ATP-binding cassette domain-containing protein [Acidisoma cellulosilyticum]MCB8880900.1 ABC-F family ATP-binding cassette domain-containing protein [Acidisoma cellulosilyticum]
MSLITLDAIGITLGLPIFSNLSLTLHKGDRLGLVAGNGQGKSTLLQLLADKRQPSSGTCHYARSLGLALMPQTPDSDWLARSVEDVVIGNLPAETREWDSWRAAVALEDIGVPPAFWQLPLGQLSGGWQRMVLLARTWVGDPDILLLDEPTNHLDFERISQLQAWILRLPKDKALIIASHDRAFLDSVSNRTLFLRADASLDFAQNYTAARASLDNRDEATARRFETDLRQAAQLRRQAAKLRNIGINSGSDLLTVKTKQLKDRAERIEAAARPAHQAARSGLIRLSDSEARVKFLLAFDNAVISAPDGRRLFRTGKLWIAPGDRIVLLGPNGAGKSCLLTRITAAIRGEAVPGITCAASVIPGICDQTLSHLRADEVLHHAIRDRFLMGDQPIRALLAGAGFPLDKQGQTLAQLSGGQRARLAMLILRLEQPNLFLLDEPTNHLDIAGQEALEAELTKAEAACLMVSHDRHFIAQVANRFLLIRDGRLDEIEKPATVSGEV